MLQGLCNSEMGLILQGLLLDKSSCIVSYFKAKSMMEQECQAFIASLVSSIEETIELDSILVVSKFLNVFPKLLSGIPPLKEVECIIDEASSRELISKAPYRPSISQWKAPVLFVKKKDGFLCLCIDCKQLN